MQHVSKSIIVSSSTPALICTSSITAALIFFSLSWNISFGWTCRSLLCLLDLQQQFVIRAEQNLTNLHFFCGLGTIHFVVDFLKERRDTERRARFVILFWTGPVGLPGDQMMALTRLETSLERLKLYKDNCQESVFHLMLYYGDNLGLKQETYWGREWTKNSGKTPLEFGSIGQKMFRCLINHKKYKEQRVLGLFSQNGFPWGIAFTLSQCQCRSD